MRAASKKKKKKSATRAEVLRNKEKWEKTREGVKRGWMGRGTVQMKCEM